MAEFSWIPIYKELAPKLVTYQDRQPELIRFVEEIRSAGIPALSLVDKDAAGKPIPLREIDPFTFFANFNRGTTDRSRSSAPMAVTASTPTPAGCPFAAVSNSIE